MTWLSESPASPGESRVCSLQGGCSGCISWGSAAEQPSPAASEQRCCPVLMLGLWLLLRATWAGPADADADAPLSAPPAPANQPIVLISVDL